MSVFYFQYKKKKKKEIIKIVPHFVEDTTKKTPYIFNGHNSAKTTIKPVKYAT